MTSESKGNYLTLTFKREEKYKHMIVCMMNIRGLTKYRDRWRNCVTSLAPFTDTN